MSGTAGYRDVQAFERRQNRDRWGDRAVAVKTSAGWSRQQNSSLPARLAVSVLLPHPLPVLPAQLPSPAPDRLTRTSRVGFAGGRGACLSTINERTRPPQP